MVVIDYADRWPLTHLMWLLSNRLLQQSALRTRILMIARTQDRQPALEGALKDQPIEITGQFVPPLPDDPDGREEVFDVARDSFGSRYGLADVADLGPPGPLGDPEFGLTLAVHMAALVAVDARARGERPPRDLAGLTVYLLNREHWHWVQMFGDAGHELAPAERTFRTTPAAMNHLVYCATLVGPVPAPLGTGLVERVAAGLERGLVDHVTCYPAADPARGSLLEPLYPDRLGEDFLALTVPGHTCDYPAQSWAASTATALLAGEREAGTLASRAVVMLAAAAERWPHIGSACLFPLLEVRPGLALDAGSEALTLLAHLPDCPIPLLEAVESRFPLEQDVDLDPGIAAVLGRLAEHRLAGDLSPEARAEVHASLSQRLFWAGQAGSAVEHARRAVEYYRGLARGGAYGPHLRGSLVNLSTFLAAGGELTESLAAAEEAAAVAAPASDSVGAGDTPAGGVDSGYELGLALSTLSQRLAAVGRHDEAVQAGRRAVASLRPLAEARPEVFGPDLAGALSSLGARLAVVHRDEEALRVTKESVQIRRRLAALQPDAPSPDLGRGLPNLANRLASAGQPAEAAEVNVEALDLLRRLTDRNAVAFEPQLAQLVGNQAVHLAALGRAREALAASEEAVLIRRRLAGSEPAVHEPDLAFSLRNLATHRAALDDMDAAIVSGQEAVTIRRRLVAGATRPPTRRPWPAP